MSIVEMVQTQADHPGADRDPSDQKRTGARTTKRDESERERTAMGLTRTPVSGPRGVLGAASTAQRPHDGAHDGKLDWTVRRESTWYANHRCRIPPDMLIGQSKRACLCRKVPTDHEAHGQCGDSRNRKLRWETSLTPKQSTRSTIEVMPKPFARWTRTRAVKL